MVTFLMIVYFMIIAFGLYAIWRSARAKHGRVQNRNFVIAVWEGVIAVVVLFFAWKGSNNADLFWYTFWGSIILIVVWYNVVLRIDVGQRGEVNKKERPVGRRIQPLRRRRRSP
jgi:cell division protein FtsW (lipid II flippase)